MKTYPETPIGQPKPPTNCVECRHCFYTPWMDGGVVYKCRKTRLNICKLGEDKDLRKQITPPADCPLKQPKTDDPTP